MTMQAWGYCCVSSAAEVLYVLLHPPTDPNARELWNELLGIEPPFWGSLLQHGATIARLTERGYRIWTWDDHGAVVAEPWQKPPLGIRYRTWTHLLNEDEEPITKPQPRLELRELVAASIAADTPVHR